MPPKLPLALAIVITMSAIRGNQAAADVDYASDIQPLLHHKCSSCHGVLRQASGLRLDAAKLIRVGGDSGPAIVVGVPDQSLLIQRVLEQDADLRMPPPDEGEPLTLAQVKLLRDWIAQGAEAPADESIPSEPTDHWSYQPPQRPRLPSVHSPSWTENPIDAFVAERRDALSLEPNPPASRETWLRRVYLDLLGIPPERAELHAFLRDTSPGAYSRVVDELLERPEYGQRWGRHWMDVWRYSDWYGSRGGNEIRYSQRHIWRWRDWIVDSLNADKPYDQMILEMLAGDELAPTDPKVLPATGYLARNWYKFDRNVWMFDTVEHTAQAFLGVTLRCARCHDHKYDPISQVDYYRFRAFFEPHQVRTDPLRFNAPLEKDASLGMVLGEGIARVYDADPEAPTYLFRRGDDRSPVDTQPLSPAVPESLGNANIEIRPIALPPTSYYHNLRPEMIAGLLDQAQAAVLTAQEQVDAAAVERSQIVAAHDRHGSANLPAAPITTDASEAKCERSAPPLPPYLDEDFSSRSDRWEVVSGDWIWQDGKLLERSLGNFSTLLLTDKHPRDFRARLRYRTLAPGSYRSVGFSYDYIDQGNSQDVYTSINDTSPTVQAFHRRDGKQEYPATGIVKTPLTVGAVVSVEVVVRGQHLRIWVDGEPKLDYVLPTPRRDGRFALWVHQGTAEFLNVLIEPLPSSESDRKRQRQEADARLELARHDRRIATAELEALRVTIAAERAKYFEAATTTTAQSALDASTAQRRVAVYRAERSVYEAEQQLESLRLDIGLADTTASAETNPGTETAFQAAEQQLETARQTLSTANQEVAAATDQYEPLGPRFPDTSSGRRTALARWIVNPEHPRTARIAVNQIWLKHFDQALVPTVANFGLNGQPPSHPELLDWLATEFVAGGWRMKPLHRLIVLSATYRQSSATAGREVASSRDPDNRWLWRMNSRRMEAEVIRDSLLAVAGNLDLTSGGPELAETEAQASPRRSLYFRNTPNEQAPFLTTFDVANPNECYERRASVVPQQALALLNSDLAQRQARILAERLSRSLGNGDDDATRTQFVIVAWETVLGREPTDLEREQCQRFLAESTVAPPANPTSLTDSTNLTLRPRELLLQVLLSHNDFITIR